MNAISTYFKVIGSFPPLPFSNSSCNGFNFVDFYPGRFPNNRVELLKRMEDSYQINVYRDQNYEVNLRELRLTNSSILTWEDFWIDRAGLIIDPLIEIVNLQKNALIHANFNLPRKVMRVLNLEDNPPLQSVFLHESLALETLNLSNCPNLELVNLGFNGSIKTLLVKNCNLSSQAQESILGSLRPVKTTTSNVKGGGLFALKKTAECAIDLRGTEIDWANRRIASKIRMLLCNNWMVLWDNPPPESIVPPHFYSFFTNNLETKLFKEYYG